jgi:hypothetical protein
MFETSARLNTGGTAWGAVGGLGDRPDRVHVTMPHPGTSIKEQGRKELGEVGRLAGQQAPVGYVSDEFVSTGFGVAPSSSELGCKRAAEEVPEVQLSKSSGASDVGGARTRVTSSRGPRAGQEGAERGRGEQGHRKPVIQARGGGGESSHDSMRLGGQQLETGAIGPEQEPKEAKLGERQTDERTRPGQALEKKRGEDHQLLAQVEVSVLETIALKLRTCLCSAKPSTVSWIMCALSCVEPKVVDFHRVSHGKSAWRECGTLLLRANARPTDHVLLCF